MGSIEYQEAGPKVSSGNRYTGSVTLGIMPDVSGADTTGLKVLAVTKGKPGYNSGLQKGDIIYDDYNGCECMIINITQKGGQKTPVWILNKELEDEIDMYTLSKWIDWKYYFVERDKCFGDSDETTLIQTNYVWYWKDLKSAVKSCGYDYKDWSTHDFRRCVGGDVWAATKDPLAVQRILRHVRFETTQRYLKNSGLQNKEILSKLNEAYK